MVVFQLISKDIMNRFTIYTCMLVVALLSAVSCSKQEQPVWSDNRIAFRAGGPGVDLDIRTRTVSETTASTLESSGFYVSAVTGSAGSESSVWNSVSFTKDGTYFEGDKYWPNSNPSYKFYASSLAITYAAAGSTVNASNTSDVVCSYMASPTYKSPNTFIFEHIFARIGDVTVSARDGYTITGVSVSITPKTGGVYNMRTGSGQSDGTGWSSVTTGSATNIANATPGTKSNDLYLVPGNYDIAFSWTASKGGYSEAQSRTIKNVAVTGGKVNSFSAGLTGSASEIEFGVSITPWTDNAVAMGDVTPEEEQVYSFGGLEIAPGNLYWNGSAWSIDEAWNSHDTYETAYGVNSGVPSTYFNYLDMGALFESAGFTKNDGDIENLLNPLDGWRLPTLSELETLFTHNQSVRPGSSVWSDYNMDYCIAHWVPVGGDIEDGVIIFPDGETFENGYGLYGELFDNEAGFEYLSEGNLASLIEDGCIFLPSKSYIPDYDGWNEIGNGYWSSTSDYKHGYCVFLYEPSNSSCMITAVDKEENYFSVRLVRTIE